MMSEADARAAIVAEAMTWLRTPYRHCADVKGVGTDCAMLLCRVFQTAVPHLVDRDYDPRPYPHDWYLHEEEERYLAVVKMYAHRVEVAKPGDIEVFRFGRAASHGAIVVSNELMLHANRLTQNVELCERRSLAHRFDSPWSVFP
jgi:NlpC/P60 family putative phage cell wall peptidase